MSDTGKVVVIDQHGRHHSFDADDWAYVGESGYVEVTKNGERVAAFAPGHAGLYKGSAAASAPVVFSTGGGGGGGQ